MKKVEHPDELKEGEYYWVRYIPNLNNPKPHLTIGAVGTFHSREHALKCIMINGGRHWLADTTDIVRFFSGFEAYGPIPKPEVVNLPTSECSTL